MILACLLDLSYLEEKEAKGDEIDTRVDPLPLCEGHDGEEDKCYDIEVMQGLTKGKNAMPPQAGGEYSDQEVANAVVYMANEGGANFEAPKLEEKKEGDE